jgi:hypothetical protein
MVVLLPIHLYQYILLEIFLVLSRNYHLHHEVRWPHPFLHLTNLSEDPFPRKNVLNEGICLFLMRGRKGTSSSALSIAAEMAANLGFMAVERFQIHLRIMNTTTTKNNDAILTVLPQLVDTIFFPTYLYYLLDR